MADIFEKNCVIGLYGINSVGKSVLSQKLTEKFKVCELQSTDNLLKMTKYFYPENEYAHCSSCTAWKVRGSKTEVNIIEGFKGYREYVEGLINCLIQRVAAENFTMIFEGIHFNPQCRRNNEGIVVIPVLLTLKNIEKHRQRIIEKSNGRKELEERLLNNMQVSRVIQDFLIPEAK